MRKRRKAQKKRIEDPEELRKEAAEVDPVELPVIDLEELEGRRELMKERDAAHQEIVIKMARLYIRAGIDTSRDNFDLLAEKNGIAVLHEMKTLSPTNERIQVRNAVGQLLYYERFDLPEVLDNRATRIVKAAVFGRCPHDSGHLEYLESVGILPFWVGDDGEITGTPASMEFLEQFIG